MMDRYIAAGWLPNQKLQKIFFSRINMHNNALLNRQIEVIVTLYSKQQKKTYAPNKKAGNTRNALS